MSSDNNHRIRFTTLFEEYKPRFTRYAASYIRNDIAAEDIVMESFMYYWENKDGLENDVNIPAYILTIVKNKSLNYLRSQKTHKKVEDQIRNHNQRLISAGIRSLESSDPQFLFSKEAEHIINQVIEKLPDQTREIFIRNRFQGKTYKEIALELGTTEKTVEFHIKKALKELRVALKDYFPLYILLLFFPN